MNVKNKVSSSEGRLWTSSFVMVSLVNLCVFMGFHMTNTGLPVYVDMLGANAFQVGLIGTFATGAALLTRPFTGLMVDYYGRKGVLVAGMIVTCLSVGLLFVFPLVSAILMLRLVQGIGWGLASTATSTIVADCLPKDRFAEGMGYFAMTTSLATAVAPALSIVLLEQFGSDCMLFVTLICMLLALVFAIFGRFMTPGKIKTNKVEASSNKTISADNSFVGKKEISDKPKNKKHIPHFCLSDLFESRAALPSVLAFLVNVSFAPIGNFLVLYSMEKGVEGVFIYFVIYAVVNIISRPLMGKLIDRFGYFIPSMVAAISIAATLLLIAWGQNLVVFCVAGVFAGIGFGTAMGVFQTMAVASVEPYRRGVATSTYLFGMNGGMTVGAFIAGIIASPFGYSGMFLACVVMPVAVGVIVLIIGPKQLEKYRA